MSIQQLSYHLDCLTVYRSLAEDAVIKTLLTNNCTFGQLYFELAKAAEHETVYLADGWQNHLLNLILKADNSFSRQAALYGNKISPSLRQAAAHDLTCLQVIFQASNRLNAMSGGGPGWDSLCFVDDEGNRRPTKTSQQVAAYLATAKDWRECIDALIHYYQSVGVGIFGQYHALRWDGEQRQLVGVQNPDPITLDQLVGYHWERQQVVNNTTAFLAGYPAHNVLLYGDRGTGKSSTVKALVNAFGDQGLRLVEVAKKDFSHFPTIIGQLAGRPQHFIIFIDDLSYEEHEVEYKELKALLEGGVETKPKNLLIYATSNRRHLIRESFSDRQLDDVHAGDTTQEKLSLSDRFGLTVSFIAPEQKLYLEIVERIADSRGIEMAREELHHQALQWALRHSGRSGRVAKQFVDHLEAQLCGRSSIVSKRV